MEEETEKKSAQAEPDRAQIVDTVEQAVLGTKGVSRLVPRLTQSITGSLSKSQSRATGMRFSENSGSISVDLYLSVLYGYNIPQVSWEVQSRVQDSCLRDLGLRLKEINIHVQGVDLPEESKEAPQKQGSAEEEKTGSRK